MTGCGLGDCHTHIQKNCYEYFKPPFLPTHRIIVGTISHPPHLQKKHYPHDSAIPNMSIQTQPSRIWNLCSCWSMCILPFFPLQSKVTAHFSWSEPATQNEAPLRTPPWLPDTLSQPAAMHACSPCCKICMKARQAADAFPTAC